MSLFAIIFVFKTSNGVPRIDARPPARDPAINILKRFALAVAPTSILIGSKIPSSTAEFVASLQHAGYKPLKKA